MMRRTVIPHSKMCDNFTVGFSARFLRVFCASEFKCDLVEFDRFVQISPCEVTFHCTANGYPISQSELVAT